MSISDDDFRVAVCIPTLDRPDEVSRALRSLLTQERPAEIVLIVDSSSSDETRLVCQELAGRLAPNTLLYERTQRGLTLQRRRGIERLREDPRLRYICFLDDDVAVEPDFLSTIVGFMESDEGKHYGGVSGYDVVDWGRPFGFTEKLYNRLGIFDGELRPGRWLYCGYFVELDHLALSTDVCNTRFLPGGLTVWRSEVFDRFLPPLHMPGYALNEDKHFSLRVGTRFRLAVHCGARASHMRAATGRPPLVRFAYNGVRALALMIRECDLSPTVRRYLAFLAFQLLWIPPYVAGAIARRRPSDLKFALGMALGWISCIIRPPRRTPDGLPRRR